MAEQPHKDGKGEGVRLPAAYYKAEDRSRHIVGSPPSTDWKLPVLALIVALLIAVGIGYAVYEAEPADPWLNLARMQVASDEGYVYIALQTAAEDDEPPWDKIAYRIGIDSYDEGRGARTLPPPTIAELGSGIEFLLEVGGPANTFLHVIEGYDPYGSSGPISSPRSADASFVRMEFDPSRTREVPVADSRIVNRGIFVFGGRDSGSEAVSSRADIAVGEGVIELRIPWALLNVSDPSTRTVLHSESDQAVGTVVTNGLRIYAISFAAGEEETRVADAIPPMGDMAPIYRWSTWEVPKYRIEPKRGVSIVRETLQSIPDHPTVAEAAPVPEQPEGESPDSETGDSASQPANPSESSF